MAENKVPEKIYIDARQHDDYGLPIIDVTIDTNKSGHYGLWTENPYGTGSPKNCNIEYVLKSVADKKVADAYNEGLDEGIKGGR